MVKGKARAAGSFLGGIANNPGIVILGGLAIALLFFQQDIRKAFGSLGESISGGLGDINIQLPEIKLPDITLPEITFPEFPDFTNLFAGFQSQLSSLAGQIVTLQGAQVTIPPDTTIDPETGIVTSETPPTIDLKTGEDLSTLFGELRPKVFDTLQDLGFSPAEAFGFLKNVTTIEGLNQVLQSVASFGKARPVEQTTVQEQPVEQTIKSFLIDEQTQQFGGGGVSFIGGSIFETPLENLTLNQIINMFNVSASKASSLRREAAGFPSTETGFTPPSFFDQFSQGLPEGIEAPGFGGFTGDPQFQGLTPEEIVLRLLGGNIQNF